MYIKMKTGKRGPVLSRDAYMGSETIKKSKDKGTTNGKTVVGAKV